MRHEKNTTDVGLRTVKRKKDENVQVLEDR